MRWPPYRHPKKDKKQRSQHRDVFGAQNFICKKYQVCLQRLADIQVEWSRTRPIVRSAVSAQVTIKLYMSSLIQRRSRLKRLHACFLKRTIPPNAMAKVLIQGRSTVVRYFSRIRYNVRLLKNSSACLKQKAMMLPLRFYRQQPSIQLKITTKIITTIKEELRIVTLLGNYFNHQLKLGRTKKPGATRWAF